MFGPALELELWAARGDDEVATSRLAAALNAAVHGACHY